ncbi:SixA phosphatase family protein [Sneathiella chinensis]|uniref:Phosphohistidine phosphatase n=1 Tax=Sneathiella chinensis TaxID=349750 RepID=A0ABQ5TYQ2_9PROT|nr:histidine phosphatase family protein [Sneathiella chinensis]GLQ05102.1 phosphohistidine phosphatase [Sneathiella chinensis]
MPRLTLLRHAKSSWEDLSLGDIDRPLAPRGKRDAVTMGKFLLQQELAPELVICSPALRTRETLARLHPFMPKDVEVRFDKMVYSAGMGSGLITLAKGLEDAVRHVMIIGHNPTMHELALSLVDWTSEELALQQKVRRKFPTAALACIEFSGSDWSSLERGQGRLVCYGTPKMIARDGT